MSLRPAAVLCSRRAHQDGNGAGLLKSPAWRELVLCALFLGVLWALMASVAQGAVVEIGISHVVAGQEVQPASLRYQNAAGEDYSITRISYLLSGFALERTDGTLFESTNDVAWFDAERGRNSFRLEDVPPGTYRAVRFHVGLSTNLNHADVATLAAEHPLNPNLNGLHWSWQGGYVFLALEGMWKQFGGAMDGWSFHLARDTNRTAIVLATPLVVTQDLRIALNFDIAPLLSAPRPISFVKDGSSTHSRDGDAVAAALRANLPSAFQVRQVVSREAHLAANPRLKPLFLPKTFAPYRFGMSATFPIPDLPQDNPLIEERVELGGMLFHDRRLSRDRSLSCASCHDTKAAFADPRRVSLGVENRTGTRNAMPLFNLAWKKSFFWDGRAPSLREQALMPIQDHNEMDESLTNLVAKLSSATNYAPLFERAFGSSEITAQKLGLALEQFILTLTSFDAKFDRVMRGQTQFSDDEKRGFELFMTEFDPRRGQYGADCFHCHGGPLFQSQAFANNGLDESFSDPGRGKVSGKTYDNGKFATPSLRNIALTAPYMHDGRFDTLEDAVEHYSTGVKRSSTLDPNIAKHPDGGLHLSPQDKAALVAFLKTLTDEKYVAKK